MVTPVSARKRCCTKPSHTASTASTVPCVPAATAAAANAGPTTLATSSTRRANPRPPPPGAPDPLPCRCGEEVNAPQQQLRPLLGQLRHAGLHACPQRP